MDINYNKEPVHFCKVCLSLAIKPYSDNVDYCNECGSTRIGYVHIFDWEKLYKLRYGKKFIDKV